MIYNKLVINTFYTVNSGNVLRACNGEFLIAKYNS